MTGIVESKKSHVAAVYNNLRQADRDEIEALGKDAFTSLRQGFRESAPCYTWMYKDEPSALLGCVPYSNGAAAIWMLGTDNIANHRYAFMKTCVPFHKELVRPYQLTANVVDERNEVHMRFIKYLGYNFIARRLMGPNQMPFIEFARLNHV